VETAHDRRRRGVVRWFLVLLKAMRELEDLVSAKWTFERPLAPEKIRKFGNSKGSKLPLYSNLATIEYRLEISEKHVFII
jgi:hypothetical protein